LLLCLLGRVGQTQQTCPLEQLWQAWTEQQWL
jgi:hypothetical protein